MEQKYDNLKNFVRIKLSEGSTVEEVREELRTKGLSEESIDELMLLAKSGPNRMFRAPFSFRGRIGLAEMWLSTLLGCIFDISYLFFILV